MSVDATSSTSSAAYAAASGTAEEMSRVPIQTLGQEDFLKLLVAQLSAQDPLNPKTDTEFIAQMAQFSALEQTKSMQKDIAELRTQQSFAQAGDLLGREVMLLDEKGVTVTQGVVSAIRLDNGTPKLVVGSQSYDLGQVVLVTNPTVTSQP